MSLSLSLSLCIYTYFDLDVFFRVLCVRWPVILVICETCDAMFVFACDWQNEQKRHKRYYTQTHTHMPYANTWEISPAFVHTYTYNIRNLSTSLPNSSSSLTHRILFIYIYEYFGFTHSFLPFYTSIHVYHQSVATKLNFNSIELAIHSEMFIYFPM